MLPRANQNFDSSHCLDRQIRSQIFVFILIQAGKNFDISVLYLITGTFVFFLDCRRDE